MFNNLQLSDEERYTFIDYHLNDTKELVVNKFINHYYEKNFGRNNTNANEKFSIVYNYYNKITIENYNSYYYEDYFYFPEDAFVIFRDITVKIFYEKQTILK
jgi:hypothetical protein